MRKNKFLSFALSVAVAAPSLMGLSAVQVTAAEPEYTDWNFSEPVYCEDFEESSIENVKSDGWSFSDDRDNHRLIRDDGTGTENNVLALMYAETAIVSKTGTDDTFYYTYRIRMYHETAGMQVVRLAGADNSVLVSSPLEKDTYYTFTTVVDTQNDIAYTYNLEGKYETVVTDIKDKEVTGIVFEGTDSSQNKAIWVDDINYGAASLKGADDPESTADVTPTATAAAVTAPSDGLSYWDMETASYTEDFKISAVSELDTENWVYDTNAQHAFIRDNEILQLRWAGYAKYNNSADRVFYYSYNIRMSNDEADNCTVSLEGIEDGIILSAPLKDIENYYKFTTVVDPAAGKAYTYDSKGVFVKENKISDSEEVSGITFRSMKNTSEASIMIDDFEFGYADAKAEATPTATAEATPVVTEGATPTATAEATPGATEGATPAATAEATPAATEDATPTATAEATPAATAEVTPTATATPEATSPSDGLSYWDMEAASYTEDFKISAVSELDAENWVYDTNAQHAFIRENEMLQLRWAGYATYNNSADRAFYYSYNIRMSNDEAGNCTVSLEGLEGGIVLSAPLTDIENYYKFTTVVDPAAGKAYTYDGSGTLVAESEISDGEKVSGITFRSMKNTSEASVMINDFEFGYIKSDTPATPAATAAVPTATAAAPTETAAASETSAPTEGASEQPTDTPATERPESATDSLSYWELSEAEYTELFNFGDTAILNERNWLYGSDTRHVTMAQNNGSYEYLQLKWAQGWAEYTNVPADSSFYYTYKLRMTDTEGNHRVSLSGITDGTLLTSPLTSSGEYYTFTTVVDIYSRKAYTYDESGTIVNETVIPENESVTGIRFECLNDTARELFIDEFRMGLVDVDLTPPDDIIVRSDMINEGNALESGTAYSVTAASFEDTVIKFDDPVSVMEDGSVPIYATTRLDFTGENGTELPAGISTSGNVLTVSTDLAEGTYSVSITASSMCAGSAIFSKTYELQIVKNKVTPDEIMNDYIPNVTYNGETVENGQEIFGNISLPGSTSYMDIVWSSDNADVISETGEVKRPLEDTTVTLTATIASVEDPSKSKNYTVSLLVNGVGEMLRDASAEATAALVSADDNSKKMDETELADLHEDVKLYTDYTNTEYYGHENVVYAWSTDSDALKIEEGEARIYPTEVKKYEVKLILTVSDGVREITEEIPVTVNLTPANAADKYAVRCDDAAEANFEMISEIAGETISSDISVPKTGIFGSRISWTSSAPMYLTSSGEYTQPSSNTSATLTGVVSRGSVMSDEEHSFRFTLKGKRSSSSGGGGNSGGGGGGGSFTVPSSSIASSASNPQLPSNTTQQTGTPSIGFTDLGGAAWAAEAINALAERGIVSGKSEGIFAPNDNITRAEFAKIVVSAFGLEDDTATVDIFSDVNEGDWYYSFIAAAYNNGIINGYDNGTFGVNDNITRQDMAVIIYRAAERAGISFDAVNEEITFEDGAEIADYARDAVRTLQTAGVINGISDTEFAPGMNATRAQAAKMIYLCI